MVRLHPALVRLSFQVAQAVPAVALTWLAAVAELLDLAETAAMAGLGLQHSTQATAVAVAVQQQALLVPLAAQVQPARAVSAVEQAEGLGLHQPLTR